MVRTGGQEKGGCLKAEPKESDNLAKKVPEKAEALFKELQAWRKSVDAQMMTDHPNRDPSKLVGNKKQKKAKK